jgi:hypothetical protein
MAAQSKNPDPSQFPAPEHRLNVILEEMKSEFRAVHEGLADIQEKVSQIPEIRERLERVEADVSTIKAAPPTFAKRLTALETHS